MFRTIVCCAALTLGLSLNAIAAPACDDAECRTITKAKPLNIMQFMREQAASTRAATPRQSKMQPVAHKVLPVAHVQRPARRAVAARSKPAGLPTDAAASYAAQQPPVQVVASDEFNDIDRAAPATAASEETTGAASAAEPNVQLVDTEEFNNIDRKAEDRLPLSATARIADAHASAEQSNSVSWLQWIWSAVASTFAALATAVHQLIGL